MSKTREDNIKDFIFEWKTFYICFFPIYTICNFSYRCFFFCLNQETLE